MRVVLDNPSGEEADVELALGGDDVTVGDLLETLSADGYAWAAGSATRGIVIDGRFCHADLSLAEIGLYEGAVLTPADRAPQGEPPLEGGLALRIVAGLDAGRSIELDIGEAIAGRGEDCDIELSDEGISRAHFAIAAAPSGRHVTLRDLGSGNGTWVGRRIHETTDVAPGAVFEAGDVAFTVAEILPPLTIDPVRQASLAGTIAFNRPPRERPSTAALPIKAPGSPGEPQKPHFSVASAVAPLIMGAVMVVVLHNILYAAFMLMSPILVFGSYYEQKRSSKRSNRGDAREFAEALTRFTAEVTTRQTDELRRRRDAYPDLAELVNRAIAPDPHLWERRFHHDDFLALSAGLGDVGYRPELADRAELAPEAEVVLADHGWLELAPIEVELAKGGVVGIVGDRATALAIARGLVCQATTLHGPADLELAVLASEQAGADWDWVKWLPHVRDATGGSGLQLAVGDTAAAALASTLSERDDELRTALVVFDSPALIEGRGAPGRALLRGTEGTAGIVMAATADRLPAACTTVIELADEPGEAAVLRPAVGQRVDPVLVAGVSEQTARACALAQARFEDADLQIEGGSLPGSLLLPGLIGMVAPDAPQLLARWERTRHATTLNARFAMSEDGPLDIDLVADGPHGLVAGTTGAGKSELLRSLVASLVAAHGPSRVNFVLIDYKGGSAFAECAALPHTVGMVTDLDEHLGERALLSLEAELRYRERVLRDHRASDIFEHDRLVADGHAEGGGGGWEPLPRLVVIIDEFATLAAELPDFISSLVGIAQRGRSLGVHMILATQRPAGAVNENIRANTNLRICLRVQTPGDSSDVIDSPLAAKIPRSQPGRAQIRLGPTDLIPAQTALVTGSTADGPGGAVIVEPFAPSRPVAQAPVPQGEDRPRGPTDLARLVSAIADATAGDPPPRRPWLEPLPGAVDLEQLLERGLPLPLAGETGNVISFALADDPAAQAQYPIGWNLDAGNLLLYGIGGSGTTTALRTLVQSLALTGEPDRVHIYVMDFGAGELAGLSALAHVGAVITAVEHERQVRLLKRLRGEVAARRGLDPAGRARAPRIVLLIDGYAGFVSEHGDLAGDAVKEAVARVWADGPELGIHMAIAADRLGAVPMALASLAQQRLGYQLADPSDYVQFGVKRNGVPKFSPGLAVIGGSGQVIQTSIGAEDLTERLVKAGKGPLDGGPPPVEILPESVPVEALLAGGRASREPLFIPVGIGDDSLEPVGFELYEGDHAVIAGPPRTGRSTALKVVAEVVARLYPDLDIVGIGTRRSALRDCPQLRRFVIDPEQAAEMVTGLRESERHSLLLIDDADAVDDPKRVLSELFGSSASNVTGVIAGRADELRGIGHWASGARRSRVGLLLQPDVQMDGMLFGVTLPRRPTPPVRPGCGYRVDSAGFEIVQVAAGSPDDVAPDSVAAAH